MSAASKIKNIGHAISEAFHLASGSKALKETLAGRGLSDDRSFLPGGFSRSEAVGAGLGVGEAILAGISLFPVAGPAALAFAAVAGMTVALIPSRMATGNSMARENRRAKAELNQSAPAL